MGSGHILVYAFDVLMQIYTAAGWDQREAAQSILKNNLYGLDIDDRAAQLAYFAVMMKARQYDRRIFSRGIQPHVYAIVESNGLDSSSVDYFTNDDPKLKKDFGTLMDELRDAKEYGSILNISQVDFTSLYDRVEEVRADISMFREIVLNSILPLIQVAEAMAQKYDVVVTNPPYMAVSNAGAKVNDYVKKYFPDSKSDLFAVFIERCGQMAKKNGYQAMITQHAWMFLSSFEKLRTKLLSVDIVNMAHLGARAFEEIGGEVVQTTSFVIRKSHVADYKGEYCRLIESTTQQGKEDMFLAGENRYEADQCNFSKIPGSPVAYNFSDKVFYAFEEFRPLPQYGITRLGMTTASNETFVRLWFEVAILSKFNGTFQYQGIIQSQKRQHKYRGDLILGKNNGKPKPLCKEPCENPKCTSVPMLNENTSKAICEFHFTANNLRIFTDALIAYALRTLPNTECKRHNCQFLSISAKKCESVEEQELGINP